MADGIVNVSGTTQSEIEAVQQNIDNVKELIGQPTNTGGTTTAGTVMAKLNKALQNETDINALIGATTNTGGTTSAGTVMAKLNKFLTDWTTTRAGYIDTINTNAARLTSARATKLDNIGVTGDTGGSASAGTIMAKLNKLLTDWTTTRAGKIDTINTNASNLNTRLTSTRAGYLDKLANFGATGDTGGTATAGTAMAKLNALLSKISGGVGIKSVQRGTFVEDFSPETAKANRINISTVDPKKTFVIINGGLSAGYSSSSSAVRGYVGGITATSFTYYAGRASLTIGAGSVSYQVVEFY